jgi:MHS family shikimate/dehydroshikimate transporter-like MFS transporter
MKVAISSALGYSFETYDLTAFLFASTLMAPYFFPTGSFQSSVLLAFLAFALAFVARPLGGFVFGHLGDTRGRKRPWLVTLVGMGGATLLIGFLPTFSQVGFLSTIMLVALRLLQGFFLAGEQSAGWIFTEEVSPPGLRGLLGGVVNMGTGLAQVFLALFILVASALAPGPSFAVIGWRIIFWLGALPATIAFVVRWRIDESTEWKEKASKSIVRIPIVTVFEKNLRFFAIVCVASFGGALLAYGSIIYIPSFLRLYTNLSSGEIAGIVLAINLSYIAGAPVGGYLSDRLRSRKRYLIMMYLIDGLIVLPTLTVLTGGSIETMVVVGGIFGFLSSFFLSTIPAWWLRT